MKLLEVINYLEDWRDEMGGEVDECPELQEQIDQCKKAIEILTKESE